MDNPGTWHPAYDLNPTADDPRFPVDSWLNRVEIQLDRLPVASQIHVPAGLDKAALHTAISREIPGMVVSLAAKVLAHQLPPERISRTRTFSGRETGMLPAPATWWDHFKLTYARRWWWRALRWLFLLCPARIVDRPVHVDWSRRGTIDINLSRYRTFPEATVRFPDNLGTPRMVCLIDTSWDRQR